VIDPINGAAHPITFGLFQELDAAAEFWRWVGLEFAF